MEGQVIQVFTIMKGPKNVKIPNLHPEYLINKTAWYYFISSYIITFLFLDYSLTADSVVCIITAGKRQKLGQSRIDILEDNIEIIKNIMCELIKYSPNAFFIIASNPGT